MTALLTETACNPDGCVVRRVGPTPGLRWPIKGACPPQRFWIYLVQLAEFQGDDMKPSIALQSHREKVRNIALSHRVKNVRVFGSVLHGNDTDDSDLDLLVDPTPDTTLMDIGAIRFELRNLLGVPVDVLTPMALPAKFRNRVIEEARPI